MKHVHNNEKLLATSKIGDKFRVFLSVKVVEKLKLKEGDRLAFIEDEHGDVKVFRAIEGEIEIVRE